MTRLIPIVAVMTALACQTDDAPRQPPVTAPQKSSAPSKTPEKVAEKVPEAPKQAPEADQPTPKCTETSATVRFTTSDGVELVADLLPASTPSRGAVVLFHQIPPSNDRTGYPRRVLDALNKLDLNVLNVDRRGAGESSGKPREAYRGPGGRLDMEAAIRFLQARPDPCKVDLANTLLVGASNGTTSVLDYTLAHAKDLPDPKALVMLSAGTYSEIQHAIVDHKDALAARPILWIHPSQEPYTRRHKKDPPKAWSFLEIKGGKHGTGNFDGGKLEAVQLPAIVDWARTHIGSPSTR